MLQPQDKKIEEKGIKLPAVSERDKAAAEFDEKGKTVDAAKKGTTEDDRVALTVDKQKKVELDLLVRNPNTSPVQKMDEIQKYFVKHGINVTKPEYSAGIKALQDVIQGNTKTLEKDEHKAAKAELDKSVEHIAALKKGDLKDQDPKDLEPKLKEAYTRLFVEKK